MIGIGDSARDPATDLRPFHVGKTEIQNDQIRPPVAHEPERVRTAPCNLDEVAASAQQRPHGALDRCLVIDEQDTWLRRHDADSGGGESLTAAGTAIVNCAPPSGLLSAHTLPCSTASSPFAIARPMPVPDTRDVAALPR